ncbi:nucleotidyltransferase domain-containing protein [Nocardia higoensis]|uniref:Nucleotidyltransferase domain-containing protein n=1 Tax=Nocardia higoensis TaxID=228599 RepID=A0ABS0D8H5_9NOCA|nr:nucleotidyltransferase domain-containing protein [Nocardia higoensis]MBF6354777.1 nucleotidyltransferase domain-containing protein [Nocardia higoensis]
MSLRAVPDSMDPHIVGTIDEELSRIERDHGVHILLAIESGSRAWGFPSPDSDYDCRFVYLSGLDTYLSPWRTREVIETPLVDLLDVNGWDLAKALRLLVRGNAVLIEWLMSPIVYRGDPAFRAELLALAHQVADRDRIARHYLHLGSKQWQRRNEQGSLKKVFYALRPALALRWLREHPGAAVAPMHVPTLLAECDLAPSLRTSIDELIALKSHTREMGSGAAPAMIADFVEAEFARAAAALPKSPSEPPRHARRLATTFFHDRALALSRRP